VTGQHPRLYVNQTLWYKAMSPKVMRKAALKVPKRSAAKRSGVKQAASPKSVEFDDLLDQLAMHFNWKSASPLKDAAAVRKILLKVKIGNRRPSAAKATQKGTGRLTHGTERIMVKDDRHLKSSTGVKADRPSPSSDLVALLSTVIDQPDRWMATPNHQFGGRKPSDLVGTAEETKIFDLLQAVDQGLF
jgi:Protein of unknown function (DUF2384)